MQFPGKHSFFENFPEFSEQVLWLFVFDSCAYRLQVEELARNLVVVINKEISCLQKMFLIKDVIESIKVSFNPILCFLRPFVFYLRYKTITSQNGPSKAQIFIFYFVEKLCSLLKIFNFLYF